jgi:hypothetical protein
MKPIAMTAALIVCAVCLPSCSATQGLAKALGRTSQNIGKTAGSLVNSVTR